MDDAELDRALAEAVASLSSRERNLLRFQILDGLPPEALATIYGVPAATVALWLTKARASLLAETRRLLRARQASTPDDLRDRCDAGLPRLLGRS